MKEIKRDLDAIEYELFIGNSSVTVRKFESEPDYGAAVAATFERFKQGAVKDYEFKLADFFEMNHVEAHILDFVAALHPDLFGRLDRYFSDNQAYLDPVIGRWDREIQFYVAYLDHIRPLRGSRTAFLLSRVVGHFKGGACEAHVRHRSSEQARRRKSFSGRQ